MDLGLVGRTVAIGGGSSGIGLATARLLQAEGANVAVCGRDENRLSSAVRELESARCEAVVADLRNAQDAIVFMTRAVDRFGGLDGVVVMAGTGHAGRALDLPGATWVQELATKVEVVLNSVRAALPALRRSDAGRVVTVTAPTARDPDLDMAAVSAARAAVANLSRTLALELAEDRIAVNCIGVGLTDTPRQQRRHQAEAPGRPYTEWLAEQVTSRRIPLGRPGTAVEVATAAAILVSPVLSYTTGSTLDVAGGLTSC